MHLRVHFITIDINSLFEAYIDYLEQKYNDTNTRDYFDIKELRKIFDMAQESDLKSDIEMIKELAVNILKNNNYIKALADSEGPEKLAPSEAPERLDRFSYLPLVWMQNHRKDVGLQSTLRRALTMGTLTMQAPAPAEQSLRLSTDTTNTLKVETHSDKAQSLTPRNGQA